MAVISSTALAKMIRQTDALAHKLPGDRDVAVLRQLIREMPAAIMQPRVLPPMYRRPCYWVKRKRLQRARQRSTANEKALPNAPQPALSRFRPAALAERFCESLADQAILRNQAEQRHR
jgi:hypothetical protein